MSFTASHSLHLVTTTEADAAAKEGSGHRRLCLQPVQVSLRAKEGGAWGCFTPGPRIPCCLALSLQMCAVFGLRELCFDLGVVHCLPSSAGPFLLAQNQLKSLESMQMKNTAEGTPCCFEAKGQMSCPSFPSAAEALGIPHHNVTSSVHTTNNSFPSESPSNLPGTKLS